MCFKGSMPQRPLSEDTKWGLIGAFGITLPLIIIIVSLYVYWGNILLFFYICRGGHKINSVAVIEG
jgi:hypothetical protein